MPNNSPYILLVDEEDENLLLLEELLQSEGYATLSAASGAQALALAKESPPALMKAGRDDAGSGWL